MRFWAKLAMAIGLPVIIFVASSSSPAMYDIRLGLQSSAIEAFGTPEQANRLLDRVARDSAIRDGDLEFHELLKAFGDAVTAQHRLADMDPELAGLALDVAQKELAERPLAAATQ
jgi:hypothetical protein